MDVTQSVKPARIPIENLILPRCYAEIGPLEPDGAGVMRGRGRLDARSFEIELHTGGGEAVLRFGEGASSEPEVRSLVDALFTRHTEVSTIAVLAGAASCVHRRGSFYQDPSLWHHRGDRYPLPLSYRSTGDIRHPERAKPGAPLLYRRYCAGIDKTFSVKSFAFEEHFELFCAWMNDPEVARFWELSHEPARLDGYLRERIDDPHMTPMIGYFDDAPFAYFEAYWSKEDRLGHHYDAHDYDRGFHMAVGDRRFRFQGFGRHWFLSMAHFLFLDDPRTMRQVGEPRVDQERVKGWSRTTPWEIVKEFEFPHKRAVLMMLSRERFFGSFQL